MVRERLGVGIFGELILSFGYSFVRSGWIGLGGVHAYVFLSFVGVVIFVRIWNEALFSASFFSWLPFLVLSREAVPVLWAGTYVPVRLWSVLLYSFA